MSQARSFPHQCSPFASAAAGAAICLSGGSAHAVSGNVSASNADGVFVVNNTGKLFGSLAAFNFLDGGSSGPRLVSNAGSLRFDTNDSTYLNFVGTGINVSAGLGFGNYGFLLGNASDKYLPLRFNSGGVKYGWVHVVSTNAGASQMVLDTWAYDQTGGNILTLDESITPKKLPLADGRIKLHWSNANEDGVARYEVQAQGADGAWSRVESDTPGAGSYAATVKGGAAYRLVVESSDGATRALAF